MKKTWFAVNIQQVFNLRMLGIMWILFLAAALAACGGETDTAAADKSDEEAFHHALHESIAGEVIEITEELFEAQVDEIYHHREEHLGKVVKYEGFFTSFEDEIAGQEYCFVVRNGTGYCSDHGQPGFELRLEGAWPEENDWCIVEGVLEEYVVDELSYLRVAVTSLVVTEERGLETVGS